jgi:Leucine-rich repeat (LRR) protein
MVVFEKVKKLFFTSLGKAETYAVKYLNRGGQGILYVLKDFPDKIIKVYWTAEENFDAAVACQARNQNIFQEIKNRRDILPQFIPDEKLVDFLNDFYEDCHPLQSGTCYLDKDNQQYPAQIMHYFHPFHELTDYFEGKEGCDLGNIAYEVRLNLALELLEIYGYYCQKKFDNKSLVHTDLFPDNILIIGDPEKDANNLHLTLIDWAGSGIWLHNEKKWLNNFEPLTTGKDASAFYSYPAELERDSNNRIDITKFGPHTDYWFLANAIYILLVGEQPFFFLNNTNPSNLKTVVPEIMKTLSIKEWPPPPEDVEPLKEMLSKIGVRFKPQAKLSYIKKIFETGRRDLINTFGTKALTILYHIFLAHYNNYENRPSPTLLFDEIYKIRIKKMEYHGVELYQVDYAALTALEKAFGVPIPLLSTESEGTFGYQVEEGRVTSLHFANRNITEIPFELYSLTGLKRLMLSRNQLMEIPSEISRLRYLTHLDLSWNKIDMVSEKIGTLGHLISLNLSNNSLKELPDAIKKMTDVEKIDLSYNQLIAIPLMIASMLNLTHLILHHNFIEEIPEFISNLSHLTHCDLSFNLLKTIPKDLWNLPHLQSLNLNANFLSPYIIPQDITLPPQFTMETYETSRIPKFDG